MKKQTRSEPTPKKLTPAPETTSFDTLAEAAETLSYVGHTLENSTVSGYEAERHFKALKFVHTLFQSADQQVKAHPEYTARLEQALAASKERTQ